jgi:hypothetical protein
MEQEIVNHTPNRAESGLGIKVLVEGISPNIECVILASFLRLSINDNLVSIVAIHGLDGHREDSWTAENGILWLRDLLPKELPHARIATYGYDASTGSQSNKIDETLYGHAENFILRLALLRNKTITTVSTFIYEECLLNYG